MSKSSIDHFDQYFGSKLTWVSSITKINPPKHKICHDFSENEPCIQTADYVAGSVCHI